MNTFIKLFIIIVFFLTGFYGCTDDTVGPVPENNYQYGWVAGDLDSNSYGTILYTSNGGENWLTRNNSVFLKNVSVVDICAIDKNTVFAVCDSNRILKSLDGGNNWIKLNTPDLNPVPGLACISALNSNTIWVSGEQGTVYKTIDGGNTWIQQGIGFFPAISMQGIRVINANVVYCVGNQGEGIGFAYCSKNGGSAWDTVAMPVNCRYPWL
ncbi:MAG: YCF48-related protein [Ignavibacteriae bacterium]|nr:YCF48-related protein [Ignavibacteriota bacterium]